MVIFNCENQLRGETVRIWSCIRTITVIAISVGIKITFLVYGIQLFSCKWKYRSRYLMFDSSKQAQDWDYNADEEFDMLNPVNKWMTLWFRGKCIKSQMWCFWMALHNALLSSKLVLVMCLAFSRDMFEMFHYQRLRFMGDTRSHMICMMCHVACTSCHVMKFRLDIAVTNFMHNNYMI